MSRQAEYLEYLELIKFKAQRHDLSAVYTHSLSLATNIHTHDPKLAPDPLKYGLSPDEIVKLSLGLGLVGLRQLLLRVIKQIKTNLEGGHIRKAQKGLMILMEFTK